MPLGEDPDQRSSQLLLRTCTPSLIVRYNLRTSSLLFTGNLDHFVV